MLSKHTEKKDKLQKKLVIGKSNDPLEKEADRVADQVLAAPAHSSVSNSPLHIQRISSEPVEHLGTAPASVDRVLATQGKPLEPGIRQDMEQRFGHNFSQVRIHIDSSATQSADEINARAYTIGNNIVFGAGQFMPETHKGLRLLSHELVHVIQQTGINQPSLTNKYRPDSSIRYGSSPPKIQLQPKTIPQIVSDFKSLVTPSNEELGSPTLVERGQFYWTGQIRHRIYKYIEKLKLHPTTKNELGLALFDWSTPNVFQRIKKIVDGYIASDDIFYTSMKGELERFKKEIIEPKANSGESIYASLWEYLKKYDKIKDLQPYTNLKSLQNIWNYEESQCGFTGMNAANIYTKKISTKKNRRALTKFYAEFSDRYIRDMRIINNGFRKGDVLIPKHPKQVSNQIDKMKASLDDGWILHARVLSGIENGNHSNAAEKYDKEIASGKIPKNPQELSLPSEEHSIMIIGHDNDKFVFWDPDSMSSQVYGRGLGCLYFDRANNRLSTARDDNDLIVNLSGNHRSGNHRYQVILIGSL